MSEPNFSTNCTNLPLIGFSVVFEALITGLGQRIGFIRLGCQNALSEGH